MSKQKSYRQTAIFIYQHNKSTKTVETSMVTSNRKNQPRRKTKLKLSGNSSRPKMVSAFSATFFRKNRF
jgi:hypothetical protein